MYIFAHEIDEANAASEQKGQMMSVTIEKDIPAPVKPADRNAYPFAEMEIGDSFVVELNGRTSWGSVFEIVQRAQLKHGIKLTTRLIEPGKRRIWRTA